MKAPPHRASAAAALLALAAGAAACSSASSGRLQPVDLSAARGAVQQVKAERGTGGAECLSRAEQALSRAESLASSTRAADRRESELLAQLALVGARCALESAQHEKASRRAADDRGHEIERLNEELRKAQEAQRRLDERAAFLARELDLTVTEVIRTKARLKGLETKAEASAALAEARVLMRRAGEESGSSATLAQCREFVQLAEDQIGKGNYSAAAYFAFRAQDLLADLRRPRGGTGAERGSPPKRTP